MNDAIQNAAIVCVLLAVILIPLTIAGIQSRRKRRKHLEASAASLLTTHAMTPEKYNYFDHKAILLDSVARKLLFVDIRSKAPSVVLIDELSGVKPIVRLHEGNLHELSLDLLHKNGSFVNLCFFQQGKDNAMKAKTLQQTHKDWTSTLQKLI